MRSRLGISTMGRHMWRRISLAETAIQNPQEQENEHHHHQRAQITHEES